MENKQTDRVDHSRGISGIFDALVQLAQNNRRSRTTAKCNCRLANFIRRSYAR